MLRAVIAAMVVMLAGSSAAWAQGKPPVVEHPEQKASSLVGRPLPPLSGPAALSPGLLNLQKYTHDLIFLKGDDGKLIMEKGRPKTRLDTYALVMNFFATYCGPCIREIPTFNKIAASYPGKPVRFLYVNVDVEKSAEEVKAFALQKGIAVEMVFPSVSQTIKEYQIDTLPRIVVADQAGTIQKVVMGFQEDLTAQLDREIKDILSRAPTPQRPVQ
jgi:thiol-disulfide isomerase/thioredoxin